MYTAIRPMLRLAVLFVLYSFVVLISAKPWIGLVLAAAAGVHLARKKKWLTGYGSAKFQDEEDLRRAGMIPGSGLCVGYFKGSKSQLASVNALFNPDLSSEEACERFLGCVRHKAALYPVSLTKAIHTIICAPVGVGKSSAVAVPFLLQCRESCVVLDFKGELAALTAAARKRMGHRVVLLDPFHVFTENPDTFNALDFIGRDSSALADCRDAANAIVVRTDEKEPHWNVSAILWISSMMATTALYGNEIHRSLQDVRILLTAPDKIAMAIDLMRQSEDPMLVRCGHELTQFVDKELNSVLTTSNRHMHFLDTSQVYDSTWTSSFNPSDLLTGKMTIYLILPPDRMRAQMGLLRLWISSLFRAVVRGGLQEKTKVHFVLDEAASLGQMDAMEDAIDKYRGYGIRLQLYLQSLGQLKKNWPDGQDHTLLSNTTQVFFGVNDKETSEYVSARLGKHTIIVESGGRSTGKSGQEGGSGGGSRSYSSNENKNWQQVGRELLRPEEVVGLNERTAVTFTPGVAPFLTHLVRYYEKGFRKSASPYMDFAHAFALLLLAGLVALYMTMVVAPPPLADIVRQLAN